MIRTERPRWHRVGNRLLQKFMLKQKDRARRRFEETSSRAVSAAPAGQKSAPAAGLGLRRADLLGKLIYRRLIVDPGIVGRPDDMNDLRDVLGRLLGDVLSAPDQRRRLDGGRF